MCGAPQPRPNVDRRIPKITGPSEGGRAWNKAYIYCPRRR